MAAALYDPISIPSTVLSSSKDAMPIRCFNSSLRWKISTLEGCMLSILPYINILRSRRVHLFKEDFQLNLVGKSSYSKVLAMERRTGQAFAAKKSVSIVEEELSSWYCRAVAFG